jgi:hypothetical protein
MRVGVIGRTFNDYNRLLKVLDRLNITHIVSGCAEGADVLGERYADECGIPKTIHLPNWEKHGKAAGPIRNTDIVNDSEMIVCCWDGKSKGTKDSMSKAHKLKKDIFILYF